MNSKREQILNTAIALMCKNGYLGTSMRDIASAVQMEAASLYNHLQGKEEILQETCFNMAAQFKKEIDEINIIYFSAAERLKMAIEKHISILTGNLQASKIFLHEWRHLSSPFLAEFISKRNDYENEFVKILDTGEFEGRFKQVDKKFAVLTILSSLNWIIEWYNPDGKMKPSEIAHELYEFIMSGLKK